MPTRSKNQLKFASNPWSEALWNHWCDQLDEKALQKGISPFINGHVTSLGLLGEGVVQSVVDIRDCPYEVTLFFEPIEASTIDRWVDALNDAPMARGALLNHEWTPELTELANAVGLDVLAPPKGSHLSQMGSQRYRWVCTCESFEEEGASSFGTASRPPQPALCPHVAATLVALCRTIDQLPLNLLAIRGVDVEALLARFASQAKTEVKETYTLEAWLNSPLPGEEDKVSEGDKDSERDLKEGVNTTLLGFDAIPTMDSTWVKLFPKVVPESVKTEDDSEFDVPNSEWRFERFGLTSALMKKTIGTFKAVGSARLKAMREAHRVTEDSAENTAEKTKLWDQSFLGFRVGESLSEHPELMLVTSEALLSTYPVLLNVLKAQINARSEAASRSDANAVVSGPTYRGQPLWGQTLYVSVDELSPNTVWADFWRWNETPGGLSPWAQFCQSIKRFVLHLAQKGAIKPVVFETEESLLVRLGWIPFENNEVIQSLYKALEKELKKISIPDEWKPWAQGDQSLLRALVFFLLNSFFVDKEVPRWPKLARAMISDDHGALGTHLIFEVPWDLRLFKAFFACLRPSHPERHFTPLLTLRKVDGETLAMNLAILPEASMNPEMKLAKGERPGPVNYRAILTKKLWEPYRFQVQSAFEEVARAVPLIAKIIQSAGDAQHLPMSDLADFVFEIRPTLELAGFKVHCPKALERLLRPKLRLETGARPRGKGEVTLEAMMDFSWDLVLGDESIPSAALPSLIEAKGQILPWRESYIYLDPETLESVEEILEEPPRSLTGIELLRIALEGTYHGVAVDLGEAFKAEIARRLQTPTTPVPKTIQAQLRPYQERGFQWLVRNWQCGLGSVLADDMGLGKTLQVITGLTWLKDEGEFSEKAALVVVPTSLLTNWERELARFAPHMRVYRYHGDKRDITDLAPGAWDIVLTSYGTLRNDVEALSTLSWRVLVLDEAQAIKNTDTSTIRAVKALDIHPVVAMSGTPVENRLSEYWSILSVVEPGLLGSQARFEAEFAGPIEVDKNEAALERFKAITAPFVLRRVKTDPTIVTDLPDKISTNRFVGLNADQVLLYRQALNECWQALAQVKDKAQRQNQILALITKLKAICNSPSQYLKTWVNSPDSEKGKAVLDTVGEAIANGQKVLIFTQYVSMGERLQLWLTRRFNSSVDFLTGALSIRDRQMMVDRFQTNEDQRILIVSLKAGGTGLNLTKANVVIHYDLWWNPAVERQATDRAYRIGQKNHVFVYRFITEGTFEERINVMLERKSALFDLTLEAGETWIGDMDDEALTTLFTLPEASL